MMSNSLITTGNYEVSNKRLIKEFKAIASAMHGANKSTWQVAQAIANILNTQCWKEDFKSLKEMADSIGFGSASTYSQYRKAISISEKVNALTGQNSRDILTLSHFIVCFNAEDSEEAVASWMAQNLECFATLSKKEMEETVKEHRAIRFEDTDSVKEEVIESEDIEEEVEAEVIEAEEFDTSDDESYSNLILFRLSGHTYCMPFDVIEKYRRDK